MITTLVYRDSRFVTANPTPDDLVQFRTQANVMLWVDLAAPTAEETKLVLERLFGFHPLAIEDCVIDSPFPKIEEFEDYVHLIMHAVDYSRVDKFTTTEVNLFIGRNFLVTFHDQALKPLQLALDRYLKSPATLVRGPDRFAHVILDLMVEAYKPATDELRHDLEQIESGVLSSIEAAELFPRVVALRKDLAAIRQIVRPQREIVTLLTQGKNRFIRPLILPYLRDLAEELTRIETQAGTWSEQLILIFRVYLNKSGHEANEGIRVLTGLTAITLPVILIGSWFGMNFQNMHELTWTHGYSIATVLTLIGTIGMLFFLRKKKWL